ncbi:hypothetical protein [Streptomyces sp. NPDC093094]|uniref:hypothetical protein n=1 Tax=Streptomyces sp. NPDC093094 TaxID=3366026 RepID=UPI003804B623
MKGFAYFPHAAVVTEVGLLPAARPLRRHPSRSRGTEPDRHAISGVDSLLGIRDTATEHPREVVRSLIAAVTEACQSHPQDDATALCLDRRGPMRARHAAAGADTST